MDQRTAEIFFEISATNALPSSAIAYLDFVESKIKFLMCKIISREGIAIALFRYCDTESVGVLSQFRCLLEIHVDNTNSERVKT